MAKVMKKSLKSLKVLQVKAVKAVFNYAYQISGDSNLSDEYSQMVVFGNKPLSKNGLIEAIEEFGRDDNP